MIPLVPCFSILVRNTKDKRLDAPLTVGRTLSDSGAGVHITCLAKNPTTPPSMDVVVNIGDFSGNRAPVLNLVANATNVAPGVAVQFSATASDPDGDALRYAWEFGDKTFSTDSGLTTVAKSWSAPGGYVVSCTVSDMKGKTAVRSIVVTVGSPLTFRVSGRVTVSGQPLQGVRLYADNGLAPSDRNYRLYQTYTDSDGLYSVTGLSAGSYTVKPQQNAYSFSSNATVVVGSNVADINFGATELPTVSIAPVDGEATVGTTNTGTLRISRTGPITRPCTVKLYPWSAWGIGSAIYGSDYTFDKALTLLSAYSPPQYTVTIPANQVYLDLVLTAKALASGHMYDPAIVQLTAGAGYLLRKRYCYCDDRAEQHDASSCAFACESEGCR